MNYQAFKSNSSKEYLGFCERKGFIYSMKLECGRHAVVALQDGRVTTLIMYSVKSSALCG